MNDSELMAKLKRAHVPERPDDYWNDFPAHIRMQLRRNPAEIAPRRVSRPRLSWAFDFALAAVLLFICLQFHPWQNASGAIARDQRYFHAQLARLDNGLHNLVLNTDGMGYLLAEAN
jgi:hypothetical protein